MDDLRPQVSDPVQDLIGEICDVLENLGIYESAKNTCKSSLVYNWTGLVQIRTSFVLSQQMDTIVFAQHEADFGSSC